MYLFIAVSLLQPLQLWYSLFYPSTHWTFAQIFKLNSSYPIHQFAFVACSTVFIYLPNWTQLFLSFTKHCDYFGCKKGRAVFYMTPTLDLCNGCLKDFVVMGISTTVFRFSDILPHNPYGTNTLRPKMWHVTGSFFGIRPLFLPYIYFCLNF